MQKIVRSAALVAALALTTTPAMFAGRMGCDPRPQTNATTPVLSVALTLLGL